MKSKGRYLSKLSIRRCKNLQIFLTALFLNMMSIIILYVCFKSKYTQPQDLFALDVLYDDMGNRHAHLIFYNVILSKVFQSLINLFPNMIFSWFSVFHYLMIFISLMLITCINLKKNFNKWNVLLTLIFSLIFGFECYCRPSYIKTTVTILAAGYYLFIFAWEKNSQSHLLHLFSMLWCVLGALMWNDFYWLTSIFFAVYVLWYICIKKSGIRYLIYVVIGMSLASMITVIDGISYKNNEDWKYVGSYQKELNQLVNCGWPEYENYKPELFDIGYTENEYYSLTETYFTDYKKNDIIKINEFKRNIVITKKSLFNFVSKFLYSLTHSISIIYSYIYIILLVLSLSQNNLKKIGIFAIILFCIICYIYLYKINITTDINMMLALFTIFYSCIQTTEYSHTTVKRSLPYLSVILIFVVMNFSL